MKRINGQSVRQFLAIRRFSDYGLLTDREELVFFAVSPTNISVLSSANVESKIRHLTALLQAMPDTEIICTDSSECFDRNLAYLKARKEEEENECVCELLAKDADFLDGIQRETASARSFFFCVRCKNMKPDQVFTHINRCEKTISDQGFEVRRLKKKDIKKMLGIYFDAGIFCESMPDTDGAQYIKEDESD